MKKGVKIYHNIILNMEEEFNKMKKEIEAFASCKSLHTVDIQGNTNISYEELAFTNCPKLKHRPCPEDVFVYPRCIGYRSYYTNFPVEEID